MKLRIEDLVLPYFVREGENKREIIPSMPGIFRLSIDNLVRDARQAKKLGIKSVILFGLPKKKDRLGSEAYSENGIVQKAVRAIKNKFPKLTVITDVCLCQYTDHGHCGILESRKFKVESRKLIDNRATLKILAEIAVSHAQAGADIVAPSAMAKGQVRAIRNALDKNGFKKTKIMGYSAKFCSNFYSPFRQAAKSAPSFGNRSGYQLNYCDTAKALKEIELDIKEGADIVMVKPALAYLDIIQSASRKFNRTLAAYNVSGEYALVKAAAKRGWIDERAVVLEILTAIKRAGADIIITYHAKDVVKWLGGR